ncbi:MAG: hypothetical protein MUF15_09995, partial [Acidobacteria bacterium]|nr:hypothetical protein [Acidobacteriota bacterium]
MEPEKSLYYLEFKKLNCRRNQVIILILFAILFFTAQLDINEDKKELKDINLTNKLEKLKVEQFDRYVPYSVYGIRLFTIPSA